MIRSKLNIHWIANRTSLVFWGLFFISNSFFAQCNVLFVLDDSGSIDNVERADMTTSVQALADQIEVNNPGIQIGVVQYSHNEPNRIPRFYTIETGFVANPTIQNIKQLTSGDDHLPAAIAEMEQDSLFEVGGIYENTGAIFIFTDAVRQYNDSVLEQYGSGSSNYCQSNYSYGCNSSPGYQEYADLSNFLGGIPISIYRVGNNGGSTVGMVQGAGTIVEGAFDFLMSTAEINTFANNISTNCIASDPCPDLTPIITILPGNIAGMSAVEVAVQLTELEQVDTDGSIVTVRVPSDPRLIFVWNVGLTQAALTPVQNSDWNYLGDNSIFHTWTYNGVGLVIPGGSVTAFGFQSFYDPQSTSGQTTITATVIPFSGGECNLSNNTDAERLVYFE